MALTASNGHLGISRSAAFASDKDALQPFFDTSFDAADFLNAALPQWDAASSMQPTASAVSLAELSTQTQSLLSQLNAQLSRLSNTLTQLTDEILRSGSRLAYEVEVLRADTTGLTDVLGDTLHDDIRRFIPQGLDVKTAETTAPESPSTQTNGAAPSQTPDYVTKLQTLTLVRTRLESVIKVFEDASDWVLPPSETVQSGLFVSAPASVADTEDRETKGREYADKLRIEIADLASDRSKQDGQGGLTAALGRIEALRDLAVVWKGTAEERVRMKFIDSLERVAEANGSTIS